MTINPIKTCRVEPESIRLIELLDQYLTDFGEQHILVITSKIVSLCEGAVAPVSSSIDDLVRQESSKYLPAQYSDYGYHFTITNNTLISTAGIDASNAGDHYILWPRDAQQTANHIRAYLVKRFGVQQAGVVITDSTCTPFRLGTIGISLAHSGFLALHNYIGEPDLFGRPFQVSRANIAGGLAASATLVMGEGAEQTPLAVVQGASFVTFQQADPSAEEIAALTVQSADDLFAPFLQSVDWQQGDKP
jgi:putative folate metabolism gamma-glutamate ligase